MYEAFYKLANDPFRLLPDPEICFPHRSCAKAWAYLRYALKRGEGIVVVTGPPGSGKTTLAERLLNGLNPAKTVSVRLIANDLNPTDLLRKLAYSFGLPVEGMDRAMLAHRIERYLIELEHGHRQAVVLIDEAQTLSHHSLEAMRLLTDLQSRSKPVLQLFLLGQEALEGVMCAPGMTQFQQRVIASCRLDRMDLAETKDYMEYRLAFADWQGDPSINGPAVMAVFRFSRGLPRHVNKICSRLLLHGCTEERHSLKQRDVLAVVQDLRDELLAPIDDEPEMVVDIAETSFGSVDNLALVPAPSPQATEKADSRDEMHALFLAEEQVPPNSAVDTLEEPGNEDRRGRWRSNGGRYFYRVGYPRPYRIRRRVQRLSQVLRQLVEGAWKLARDRGSVVGGFLREAGRRTVGYASKSASLRNSISENKAVAGKLLGRMGSLSATGTAVLGGLILLGLYLVTGNNDDVSQPTLADGEMKRSAQQGLPYLEPEQTAIGPLVLDESSQGYLDVGTLVLGPGTGGRLPGPAGPLPQPQLAAEPGLSAFYRGMVVEGVPFSSVMDNATDQLVNRAATATSTLEIWSLPDNVAEIAEHRSPAAGSPSVMHESDSVSPAVEETEPPSVREQPEYTAAASDVADEQVVPVDAAVSQDYTHYDSETGGQAALVGGPGVAESSASTPEVTQKIAGDVLAAASEQGDQDPAADIPVPEEIAVSGTDRSIPDEAAVQGSEIAQLLLLADSAIEKDFLLRPREDSAYNYLQRVLAIDPQNAEALAGLERIVRRYGDMASWAMKKGNYPRAGRYISRGLSVDPQDAGMLALRKDLNQMIAKAESAELAVAEIGRVAAQVEPPAPVPEKRSESSLSRLMRLIDGDN